MVDKKLAKTKLERKYSLANSPFEVGMYQLITITIFLLGMGWLLINLQGEINRNKQVLGISNSQRSVLVKRKVEKQIVKLNQLSKDSKSILIKNEIKKLKEVLGE